MGEEIAMTVMTEEIKASFALEDSIFSISREELVTEEILKIVSCLGALLTDGFFLFDFDSVEKICECLYFYFVHVKKVSGREGINTGEITQTQFRVMTGMVAFIHPCNLTDALFLITEKDAGVFIVFDFLIIYHHIKTDKHLSENLDTPYSLSCHDLLSNEVSR